MCVKLAIGILILNGITEAHPVADMKPTLSNTQIGATDVGRNNVGSGREKKWEKYFIPMLVGFKLTSFVSVAFAALKIFIVQSLVVSKIALLGASILALKVLYDHMRYKYSHSKEISWDDYHYSPPWDWHPQPYSYPHQEDLTHNTHPSTATDLHGLPSEPARSSLPHIHGNNTFSVRSDKGTENLGPKSGAGVVAGYETVITRITETITDD